MVMKWKIEGELEKVSKVKGKINTKNKTIWPTYPN